MTGPLSAYADLPAALVEELSAAGLDAPAVYAAVVSALQEDLPGDTIDITSAATIPADQQAVADFGARERGVVAGLGIAELVFRVVLGDAVRVEDRIDDGTPVEPGAAVMTVTGPTRGLLTAERTALNFASHLSGVATATARWVEAVAGTRARILDTRKTLPNYRALQKYAVRCGGGHNHRYGLADLAMVKDNHVVAAGGVVPAFEAVVRAYPEIEVEVEVTDLEQLAALLEVGAPRVLLDNMSIEDMRRAVSLTDGRALLEASGGLTLERAAQVAATGVDLISIGALTHSAVVFDLGMDLREQQCAPS